MILIVVGSDPAAIGIWRRKCRKDESSSYLGMILSLSLMASSSSTVVEQLYCIVILKLEGSNPAATVSGRRIELLKHILLVGIVLAIWE